MVTVQGQLVTTRVSPAVTGYSQSSKVSVVGSGQTVVSSGTTRVVVTVVFQ